MPTINGQRVLNTDPRYTNTLNARGGIDRTSQAELAGIRPQGSTGTLNNIEVKPTQPLVAPRLNPTIPDVIPSTALAGNKTFEDVMDTRADLETEATAKQQLTDQIKGTNDKIGTPSTLLFSNPGDIINRLQLNRVPTETETMRSQMQSQASQNQRNLAGDIATARTEANAQFGLPDLLARKAEVTQQYAERQNQLDADIKRIEGNASKRGVDRAAVEDMKRATQSAALEDLSNLAAIEAAVSGSITEARNIINDTINDKKYAFEQEYKAIQDDIDYYSTLVGEDNQRTAQTLQIALDEKKRLDAAQLAKETAIKNLMAEAAREGADDGTIQAILKSGTSEEALRYAAPYLGKTQRMQAQLDMAVKSEQLAKLRQPTVATVDTQIVDVGGNKQLINSQTGEVIATFGANTPTNEITQAKDIAFVNTLDTLKTHPGMAKAVGTSGLARFTPFKADTMTGDVSDFTSSVQNVVKQLTLNTFAEAKEKGMTFGAMSQGEWDILGQAATKLVGWTRTRDDESIYYDTSEKNMKKELDTLSNFGKMSSIRKGVPPEQIGVVTMDDGSYVTRNSDGTYTVLDVTAQ